MRQTLFAPYQIHFVHNYFKSAHNYSKSAPGKHRPTHKYTKIAHNVSKAAPGKYPSAYKYFKSAHNFSVSEPVLLCFTPYFLALLFDKSTLHVFLTDVCPACLCIFKSLWLCFISLIKFIVHIS